MIEAASAVARVAVGAIPVIAVVVRETPSIESAIKATVMTVATPMSMAVAAPVTAIEAAPATPIEVPAAEMTTIEAPAAHVTAVEATAAKAAESMAAHMMAAEAAAVASPAAPYRNDIALRLCNRFLGRCSCRLSHWGRR
jgi:hypothetical protein